MKSHEIMRFTAFLTYREISDNVSEISLLITKSDKWSIWVGSLLIMTKLAPVSFANKGRSAAGKTAREEPRQIKRSDSIDTLCAVIISSSGMAWPKEIVAVLIIPPHMVHEGGSLVARNSFLRGESSYLA